MRAGCAATSPARCSDLGLDTRTDRLGNLIATLDGDARRAVGDAVHPHGPARLRRAQDRGRRLHPRRAAGRRAGAGAAVAGGADLRRRRPRPRRRHRQQEPSRDDAGGEIQGRAVSRTSTSMPASPAATRRSPPASTSARRSSTGRTCVELSESRIAGTSVDDRAGCAVIVEVARAAAAADASGRPCISCSRCRRSSTCAAR